MGGGGDSTSPLFIRIANISNRSSKYVSQKRIRVWIYSAIGRVSILSGSLFGLRPKGRKPAIVVIAINRSNKRVFNPSKDIRVCTRLFFQETRQLQSRFFY